VAADIPNKQAKIRCYETTNLNLLLFIKGDVLRDSHKLLVTLYREFEQQFGGKIVLAGLKIKEQLMPNGRLKNHI
jgi:hypothetical protein